MSTKFYSPLRYPGGKTSLYDFLVRTLEINNINYGSYVEGFAGGAGAALKLLMYEYVGDIYLNDLDDNIYQFWNAALYDTENLTRLISETKPTIRQWGLCNKILFNLERRRQSSNLEIAFSTFFLNRCNRSGIITGGPIGGNEQDGEWKIDARYNKIDLIRRIEKIALYKERIHLSRQDVVTFLMKFETKNKGDQNVLLYLDPPYVKQGKQLYEKYFTKADHERLSKYLQKISTQKWIVSYDDHPLIHQIYKEVTKNIFEFNYFANQTKIGKELIICSKQCQLPDNYYHYSRIKSIEDGNRQRIAI